MEIAFVEVGASVFDNSIAAIDAKRFLPLLNDFALNRHKPIIDICRGMQFFCAPLGRV
jgi:gamma-glutamyl-gamma-aminobutyrate hydrolase PuuD